MLTEIPEILLSALSILTHRCAGFLLHCAFDNCSRNHTQCRRQAQVFDLACIFCHSIHMVISCNASNVKLSICGIAFGLRTHQNNVIKNTFICTAATVR